MVRYVYYSNLPILFRIKKINQTFVVELRDPKNDFIFNFDDKMKIFEQFEFGTK